MQMPSNFNNLLHILRGERLNFVDHPLYVNCVYLIVDIECIKYDQDLNFLSAFLIIDILSIRELISLSVISILQY